ncbi:hypothetical protein IC575_015212 [Cucumis melo]
MTVMRTTIPTTDRSIPKQEQLPFARLFIIPNLFCTLCTDNLKRFNTLFIFDLM